MKFTAKIIILLLTVAAAMNSCKKIIEIGPPQNQLTTGDVFAGTSSADAAMVNVYALFNMNVDPNYNKLLSCYADELSYTGVTQEYLEYVQSAVVPSNTTNANFWQNSYFAIYSCNSIIEQAARSTNLGITTATQLIGEAKFLRAFSYFYLINTYGAVPLILGTNVNNNATAVRSDSTVVYRQIIQDLTDAGESLPASYIGGERVRANRYAASALLSRVYLWQRRWPDAETAATSVLGSGLYTPLPATKNTFLSTSRETILAFWTQYGYISDAPNLIPSSDAPQFFYTAAQLGAFEKGDLRFTTWVAADTVGTANFYAPYKYHNNQNNTGSPEYLVALRAGEQYLIRAEARAEQNNLTGAAADLNIIRHRAGLADFTGTDKAAILSAILHERRVELFTEWGNRFLDLKRNGMLDALIGAIKPSWKPSASLLPIPQTEINTDPNLKQNTGY